MLKYYTYRGHTIEKHGNYHYVVFGVQRFTLKEAKHAIDNELAKPLQALAAGVDTCVPSS